MREHPCIQDWTAEPSAAPRGKAAARKVKLRTRAVRRAGRTSSPLEPVRASGSCNSIYSHAALRARRIQQNELMEEEEAPRTHSPRPKPGLYTLNADGGMVVADGQATGEAAIGVVLKDADNHVVEAISRSIGRARDHTVAEFTAFIEGLKLARLYGVQRIRIFLDSELVVNTVGGDWELRPEHLRPLLAEARELYESFEDRKLSWVPREMNTEADLLANAALPPRRER
jgi:ribonuclease HI